MTRTARSPIFSQSHDFSCFITDPEGTLIANARWNSDPYGGGGFAVRALLKDFAGRINPQDVFILSDYVAVNHLPDWVIARPIFVEPGAQLPASAATGRTNRTLAAGSPAPTS